MPLDLLTCSTLKFLAYYCPLTSDFFKHIHNSLTLFHRKLISLDIWTYCTIPSFAALFVTSSTYLGCQLSPALCFNQFLVIF